MVTPVDRAVGGGGCPPGSTGRKLFESIVIFCVACAIGLIAFSPLFEHRRTPGAARLPGGAAAALVGAAPRPARHRTVALVLCGLRGLGHARRQRAVRPRDAQRILPAAADVHDRRHGAEPGAERRRRPCAGAPRTSCAPCTTISTGASPRAPRDLTERQPRACRRRSIAASGSRASSISRPRHLIEAQRLANLGSWVRNLETERDRLVRPALRDLRRAARRGILRHV